MAVSSGSIYAVRVTPWPSSTWAINFALQKGCRQPADDGRHFGLVVDDKKAARKALEAAGVIPVEGPFLDFRDSWGNRVEIVGYDNIQFTKAPIRCVAWA